MHLGHCLLILLLENYITKQSKAKTNISKDNFKPSILFLLMQDGNYIVTYFCISVKICPVLKQFSLNL